MPNANAAGPAAKLDAHRTAEAVVDLTTGPLMHYLDTEPDNRPAWKHHRIDALTRFTIHGLTAFNPN